MTEQNANQEWEELARHAKPLVGYVRACRVPAADACDIVQTAFIKLRTRTTPLPTCPERRNALFFEFVKNEVRAYFTEQKRGRRRVASVQEHVRVNGLSYQRDVSAVFEAREEAELVFACLSAEQFQVFTDRVLDEKPLSDVADQLGMNQNTAKSHWLRAVAALERRMQNIENRGIRGFLILVGVSSILALANAASAMVRFFRPTRHLPVRGLPSLATAAVIALSHPNIGAFVEEHAISTERASVIVDSTIPAQPEFPVPVVVPEKRAETATSLVRQAVPRKAAKKRAEAKAFPPDYLIAMGMQALRDGNPERALEILTKYPMQNETVSMLRADAKKAIDARR